MADPVLVQVLTTIGGLGTLTALAKWFVVRPLEKAEERARAAELREQRAENREGKERARADMLAGELKATHAALRSVRRLDELDSGGPTTVPPPRGELPTMDCIIESRADRAWAEQRERERSRPLNPGRQDYVDEEARRYVADMASTPPNGFDAPEGLKPLSPPFPPRPRRR